MISLFKKEIDLTHFYKYSLILIPALQNIFLNDRFISFVKIQLS